MDDVDKEEEKEAIEAEIEQCEAQSLIQPANQEQSKPIHSSRLRAQHSREFLRYPHAKMGETKDGQKFF